MLITIIILFDSSKTCSVIFHTDDFTKDCKHVVAQSSCVCKLSGQQIPLQDNAKHLGYTIIGKVAGNIDIECIAKAFNRSVNIQLYYRLSLIAPHCMVCTVQIQLM